MRKETICVRGQLHGSKDRRHFGPCEVRPEMDETIQTSLLQTSQRIGLKNSPEMVPSTEIIPRNCTCELFQYISILILLLYSVF